MSIQQAEELKKQWTDKYVTVAGGTPELRRFDGLLGQVRTVNMNCRLLVEFDGTADIAWYDIDPAFLKLADPASFKSRADAAGDGHATPKSTAKVAPAKAAPAKATAAKTDARSASPVKPAAAGSSPLDLIRKQAASGSASAPAAAMSPMEAIRTKSAATAPAAEPASTPPPAVSPLDQIRRQAARSPGSAAASVSTPAAVSGTTLDAKANVDQEAASTTFRGATLPQQDNLKIVEGIGPKIEELLHDAGITTWQELAKQQPDRLREILQAAGPRFRMHDPSTWPTQAQLAADNRWQELEQYQETLQAGREG